MPKKPATKKPQPKKPSPNEFNKALLAKMSDEQLRYEFFGVVDLIRSLNMGLSSTDVCSQLGSDLRDLGFNIDDEDPTQDALDPNWTEDEEAEIKQRVASSAPKKRRPSYPG